MHKQSFHSLFPTLISSTTATRTHTRKLTFASSAAIGFRPVLFVMIVVSRRNFLYPGDEDKGAKNRLGKLPIVLRSKCRAKLMLNHVPHLLAAVVCCLFTLCAFLRGLSSGQSQVCIMQCWGCQRAFLLQYFFSS